MKRILLMIAGLLLSATPIFATDIRCQFSDQIERKATVLTKTSYEWMTAFDTSNINISITNNTSGVTHPKIGPDDVVTHDASDSTVYANVLLKWKTAPWQPMLRLSFDKFTGQATLWFTEAIERVEMTNCNSPGAYCLPPPARPYRLMWERKGKCQKAIIP